MQLGAIPPTEYTESYWADARKVLSVEQIADAYHRYLEAGIQRTGYIIAALFIMFASFHWTLLSGPQHGIMTSVALATALIIACLTYCVRTYELTPFLIRVIGSLFLFCRNGRSLSY